MNQRAFAEYKLFFCLACVTWAKARVTQARQKN